MSSRAAILVNFTKYEQGSGSKVRYFSKMFLDWFGLNYTLRAPSVVSKYIFMSRHLLALLAAKIPLLSRYSYSF